MTDSSARQILVVDDRRLFAFDAHYARTAAAGVAALSAGQEYDEIWLDHDLGEPPREIWPVVELLEQLAHENRFPVRGAILVCSDNPAGAERIRLALERSGYQVRRVDAKPYLASSQRSTP